MVMTARTLITRAWYLSGIVARGLQSVTGDQITDGLELLNALLDWKAIALDIIPYYTRHTFNAVVGQEEYFVENLIDVESLTFNLDEVRYATDYATRTRYFGSTRVDNINSLPFNWTFMREKGGGRIFLYFKPNAAFPIKLTAKFALTNVTLTQDLDTVYDGSYIEYLRYALAEYMCSEYGILFNPESKKILERLKKELMYVSPPDLSLHKASILTRGTGLNYADVNLGMGWRV